MITNEQASAWESVFKLLNELVPHISTLGKTGEECALAAIRQLHKSQPEQPRKSIINLSPAEIQSGYHRVRWAEGLIEQLPDTHEGRNSWILNYGVREQAQKIRYDRMQQQVDEGYAPTLLFWDSATECIKNVGFAPAKAGISSGLPQAK